MARPQKPINEFTVETLAEYHLPDEVIAKACGVSVDTLHRRFADVIDKRKAESIAKLGRLLWKLALDDHKEFAIKLLASKHLGYSERHVFEGKVKMDTTENLSLEELKSKALELTKQLNQ